MKQIKFLFNFFFGKFIFSLIRNKYFLFVDNRFLGSFVNFMYCKLSLNKNIIIVFNPSFFNKKNYLQYTLFEQAYYEIRKKKNKFLL